MAGRNVDAVFFDLDGVLVDATEWHYEALNRALGLFGFEITRYEHLTTYNGLPTRRKLEMLTVEKGLPKALHGLISRVKQAYTVQEIQTRCWPAFEKEYMLSRLRREGYRLAVCSNAVRESVTMMLERSGILGYFELLVSNEDVANPKPDPEIYLETCRRLGLDPSRVVVVEDAPHGIESARRAGTRVCEVSGFPEVDWKRLGAFLDSAQREGGASPC
ncbi:MAG: HAD family phosphatase [Fibrobacteres bacterium]|nr:HAD family phosphatase [Fibrobacterota bacterium]